MTLRSRAVGAGTESRQSSRRIGYDPDSVTTLVTRCQHDSTGFDVRLKDVTGADPKTTAKRTRENNLALGGYFGLHGKTVLPHLAPDSQARKPCTNGDSLSQAYKGKNVDVWQYSRDLQLSGLSVLTRAICLQRGP